MEHSTLINPTPFRPISAKFGSFQSLKGSKTRPQSAVNKGLMMLPRCRTKNDKPKGKKNFLSREEITERLLYFKNQANLLKEENLKLRTKVKFLEKDFKKDENESEKSHLVINLKNHIKDLQKIVENKEFEILELKKSSRATRAQELEIEMKMYVDECTRLRRMLQECFLQLSAGLASQDISQKFIQQSLQLKSLKKDYKELIKLSEDPLGQKTKTRKEVSLVKLKKNLIITKEENMRVNEDNQRLVEELNTLRNNFRCPNCGYFLEDNDNKDINTII